MKKEWRGYKMASQTNHNAAYIYTVDGVTVWERLRVIRCFIEQISQSVEMSEIDMEETDYKLSQLSDSTEDSFERRRILVSRKVSEDALKKAKDELNFLYDLEEKLMEKAEESRIEGKTDDEMYEINFFHEHAMRLVRKAHAEFISTGRLTTETIEKAVRCYPALDILDEQELLKKKSVLQLTQVRDIPKLENIVPDSCNE